MLTLKKSKSKLPFLLRLPVGKTTGSFFEKKSFLRIAWLAVVPWITFVTAEAEI